MMFVWDTKGEGKPIERPEKKPDMDNEADMVDNLDSGVLKMIHNNSRFFSFCINNLQMRDLTFFLKSHTPFDTFGCQILMANRNSEMLTIGQIVSLLL